MLVLPTTAYSQAEDALTLARALVNDSAGVAFTDTLLMPLLNSAYRALPRELAENGVSVLVEQQDIELNVSGSTGITNTEISDEARALRKLLPQLTLGTDPVEIRSATDALGNRDGGARGAVTGRPYSGYRSTRRCADRDRRCD
jgi:hypothetical protein